MFDILEHGGLPCFLPFAVHLDLGHLPDRGTQGFYLKYVLPWMLAL